MRKKVSENYWVSLSDIMTGLMVIFMFIAISYIVQIKKEQKERDILLKEFKKNKIDLYFDLKKEFEKDFQKENWNAILDEDLSIKFRNEKVLFEYGQSKLKNEFKKILIDFIPRYFQILLNSKYLDKIAEVRIEGHTDSHGSYMYNVRLSQERTANVLSYILFNKKSYFSKLDSNQQEVIKFWFTANGLSYGKTLDKNSELTFFSKLPEDRIKSRRVEFRIITKSDELVKQILKDMEKDGSL